jgi:hypothetical protein
MIRISLAALLVAAALVPAAAADFGVDRDKLLSDRSLELFGFDAPLAEGAAPSAEEGYRLPTHTAADTVAVAPGLTAEYLTRSVGNSLDMMAFWPAENPTHLIGCIEGDREEIEPGKWNPSVQSISLADGTVTTLLRGMISCDGIRTSPWGTVIATEEEDDGGVYEIIDPLAIKDVAIKDRATGETT